uniref:Chaperonin 60 subunit beta 4ic-like isoform X1 n=1 Tax=Rhizophora mucronata TaxID=61149 RepID=A0A2P2LEL6_RHIMU
MFITLNPPTEQVVRCCLEHAASVAKTFLTCDAIVVDIKELEPHPMRRTMPAPMKTKMPTGTGLGSLGI